MNSNILRGAVIAAAAIGLAGCTAYDDYGYGYSRVSVGYGGGYYTPYYGWYDNYYYPGVGYYIYDRRGTRYRWNDRHRGYWEARRPSRGYRENWSGYRRDRGGWDRGRSRGNDRRDRRRGR
jgi:hypothetical protein